MNIRQSAQTDVIPGRRKSIIEKRQHSHRSLDWKPEKTVGLPNMSGMSQPALADTAGGCAYYGCGGGRFKCGLCKEIKNPDKLPGF